ncbi:hypothetical protein FcAc13_05290 [Frischella sp. Ac13]|uniref:DUF3987 domain-containing protein n=1 Tax=Frischella japonica TaxID=2741544 RepID=A0ABR7QWZ1_9GAMM|nr:hypothetical protein [Frischella japonica]MBC9130722.1 hypothetical protein [Frischella japonica]
MTVQVTAGNVNQMLSELGYSVPSLVIDAILKKVNAISDCLVAHDYSEADQLLILIYSACLLAQMQGARKIASQSSPSGARSFKYDDEGFKSMYSLLRNLDIHGCTDCLGISRSNKPLFLVIGGHNE